MALYNLALVGFGNVGRAFARLLMRKKPTLHDQYGIEWRVTGIATGRHDLAINHNGIDLPQALALVENGVSLAELNEMPEVSTVEQFIASVPADILFENSPVNHHTGQPAIRYLEAGLNRGMHGITANKGPVAHGYEYLTQLARQKGRRFLFESAVMDGAPIFSLFRGPLPAADLRGFEGILNSCTNLIIGLMEEGRSFDDAVRHAQSVGITETDPSADIDGWDASIKVAALSTVLMGVTLKPDEVVRTGIRGITPELIQEARQAGERWKLVCSVHRTETGLAARVSPQRVSPSSPLYSVNGTSSCVQFELDVLPGLGIVEGNPGPETTAYGLLADMINVIRNS